MDTHDAAAELGKSREKAYVVGPVPDKESNVAQSLLDKQRKLGSKPVGPAVGSGPEREGGGPEKTYNRIYASRARSPASIARELELRVKQREAARAKTETGKVDGGGDC